MGTENQGLAMMLGVIALLFLVLLVVSYIVGKV
jgi:hypothetical protein